MKFIELQQEEFNNFTSKQPNSMFFQSSYWGEIKKINNWNYKIIGVKENKEIVAAALILFKKVKIINKYIAYCPRGPILDYKNEKLLLFFIENLKIYLKTNKCIFLKINPYIKNTKRDINGIIIDSSECETLKTLKNLNFKHLGFYIDGDKKQDLEPRWLSVLNLKEKNSEQLLKEMRTTTRWSIKNANKNNLRIIQAKEKDLIEFKNLMQHTANRREFIDRPLTYYKNMYKVLNKENLIKILLVEINFKDLLENIKKELNELEIKIKLISQNPRKSNQLKELESQKISINKKINALEIEIKEFGNKKIIAGGLYMLFGKQLVYLFGASYKQFMKYNSQYLLQWEMINYAIENNYDTFNFYGIDGNFDKNSKNYGLFDFKRGFGAEVVELIGELDLVINKFYYISYKLMFNCIKIIKKIIYIKKN